MLSIYKESLKKNKEGIISESTQAYNCITIGLAIIRYKVAAVMYDV
jgi:hypothetical protein